MDPKGEAAMTKDQIERYGGICDKIVALRSLKVRDTVQGSSSEIPYQKHTIVLEGGIAEGKNSKLQALKRQKAAIEAAVEAIEDETDQAVISMRVLGRMSWNDIAGQFRGHYTVDGLKKIYHRALKKYF